MIFGRDAAADHPLEAKLAPLDTAAGSDRFVGQNWRWDWRVSEPREQQLLAYMADLERVEHDPSLQSCYRKYYTARICHGSPVEYVHPCNRGNLVPGIARHYELAHVVCLNRFREAAQEGLPEARVIPPDKWGAWLDEKVETARQGGLVGVREFVLTLFHAWNKWGRIDQRPAWASFWADVEPLLAGPSWADRVRDGLGLGMVEANRWLLVLRYQVREVVCCVRPTCLDADWKPWHFPSPEGEKTGFTMDLTLGTNGTCCPEVIHSPIRLNIAHWTGHIDRTSRSPSEYDIGELRHRHYQRLRARFGGRVPDWLPALR
jgi:hypothetical protein